MKKHLGVLILFGLTVCHKKRPRNTNRRACQSSCIAKEAKVYDFSDQLQRCYISLIETEFL